MKQLWKIVIFSAFMLLAVLGNGNIAYAAGSSLPPGFLVGDDTGVQTGRDGEYFIVNNDVYPGQTFSREIVLSNYSKENGSFEINLVMNPESEEYLAEKTGAIDLLEAIHVVLTYQGEVIYEGPMNGEGTPTANKLNDPIKLGTWEIGEVRTIQADFTVSNEYPEEDWMEKNAVDFYWLFYASRVKLPTDSSEPPEEPGDSAEPPSSSSPIGKLPQTGEDWRNVLLGMIAGLVLITVSLIIAKKRYANQNE